MRALKALLAGFGLLLLLTALAAWQLPAMLDWAPYKSRISAFAAFRIGRAVQLGGDVGLQLLPEPVLVAHNVTIADRGDGLSATLGALRLQLALNQLARLRLVPRDLVLDHAELTLPWPLPRPVRPAFPPGFSARVEDGALRLGGMRFTSVAASLQADPDTGAFTAQGIATLSGLPWHFTVLLGAPALDGTAALSVTLDGQAAAGGAGGRLRGRISPGGVLLGDVSFQGPDLSALLAAPKLPFRVQGRVRVADGAVQADELALGLGNSAGHGQAELRLAPPLRLEAQAVFGQIPAGPWLAGLTGRGSPMPVHVRLAAHAVPVGGLTLRDASLDLTLDASGATINAAMATLPGGGTFTARGSVAGGADGPEFTGRAQLMLEDAAQVLDAVHIGWASGWASGWGRGAGKLTLSADQLVAGPRQVAATGLSLHAAGTDMSGAARYAWAPHASFNATLRATQLDAAYLPGWPGTPALASLPHDGALDLTIDRTAWQGIAMTALSARLEASAAGLTLRQGRAQLAGAGLQADGALGWDGSLTTAHLDVAAPDSAAVLRALPQAWRLAPALFTGPGHLAVSASGQDGAITAQLRADLNDLRAEAECRLDADGRHAGATATLRHPSAPALLAALGLPGADHWLDHGSLALTAHVTAQPGLVAARDVSLTAGVARLHGQAAADWSGSVPVLSAELVADVLPLPGFSLRGPATIPLRGLQGWQGSAHVDAAEVLSDLQPVAEHLATTLTVSGGAVLADPLAAELRGGKLAGQFAFDSDGPAPTLALRGRLIGAALPARPDWLAIAPHGGTADLAVDLLARGYSPAAMLASASGDANLALSGTTVDGIDLARLAKANQTKGAKHRTEATAALTSGSSLGLSGQSDLRLDHGAARFDDLRLSGKDGALQVSGVVDLADRSAELRLLVPPAYIVTLTGPWDTPKRVVAPRGK